MPIKKDRNKKPSNGDEESPGPADQVIPFRCVEAVISIGTRCAVNDLKHLVDSGECIGVAYGAILRGGRYTRGYTGVALNQPEFAIGILQCLIRDLLNQADENSRKSP